MRLTLIAGCTLMMATACKPSAETQLPTGNYETMTVGTSDQELTTAYSATIRGRQDIDIYPQVSGTIQQLCVAEGDKVRQGQTLFILDQVPYQAALNTAEANVKSAEAALATAELNYDSNKELFAQKVVSDFTLTTARNNFLTAQATLAQAEAQEVNARNNLSYTVVKSPSDGVVGTLPCTGKPQHPAAADHRLGQLHDVRLLLHDREPTALPRPPIRHDGQRTGADARPATPAQRPVHL